MSETSYVKCPYDGYKWHTRSKLKLVSCPSCLKKVDIQANIIKDGLENLEHFNLDEQGVRILDPTLSTQNSPQGRIIDVFFKRGKAWCEYDASDSCKHIEYALTLPVVREIFKKKGWKT